MDDYLDDSLNANKKMIYKIAGCTALAASNATVALTLAFLAKSNTGFHPIIGATFFSASATFFAFKGLAIAKELSSRLDGSHAYMQFVLRHMDELRDGEARRVRRTSAALNNIRPSVMTGNVVRILPGKSH